MSKLMTRVIIPIAIVFAGLVATRGIVSLKATAARKPPSETAPVVEVVEVQASSNGARVSANGMVAPALDVTVQPEVAGRIVHVSSSLLPGGRFKRGELLAKIDARDYELAIKQQESQVHRAELDLELEAGRQKIAKREWELLGSSAPGDAAPDLALRKPHLAAAKYNLDAAKSGLERAQLNLERTSLRAPFNAIVMTENVEVGQVVAPGAKVARLIGTDRFWVRVSVPVERLEMLDIPGINAETGSPATIVQALGGDKNIQRKGQVLRLQGELDHQTRTAQLLVAIEDPFAGEGPPLLPAAYVTVHIEGRSLPGVFAVPRSALHGGDRLWVVGAEDRLASRKVELRWGSEGQAFVTGELEAGDRVVTSALSLPVEGMRVRVVGGGDS